jgi:pyrroline-5-carboxylate reductase
MAEYQFGIIGAGNMAEAMLRGAIRSNFLSSNALYAADPSLERRQLFTRELNIATTENAVEVAGCPRLLLAVKPQVMATVLDAIASHVREDAVVISIAAGIPMSRINAQLGGKGRLVRVMPNTPLLVGAGVSAVAAGPRATDADVAWTCKLLSEGGGTAVTVSEEMMDAVTAVSGSGPAYFFYLVEAMVSAGVAEGLTPETAQLLAVQTCLGAGKLLAETGESPEVLRVRVTSPGGTTQAAIESMDASGVKKDLVSAIRAAAARSRELGK